MKLLTVAIEKKEKKEFIWGIDSKTKQFFYVEMCDVIKEKMKSIGDYLIFKERVIKGTHELQIIKLLEIESNARVNLINTLNCMATYPACLRDHFVKNNVIKIREIHALERLGEAVAAKIEICGIEGIYNAIINDSKWVNFWNDSSSSEINEKKIVDAINSMKNIYMILDFDQTFFGNELIFSGMVVEYG
ncbi:hypothetical protein [Butyrivibrio fibrisolvens]|uniref:hypothetical protein n=1 Tax=Butyrivibrio fibrisolvens TaxID=831 RepID=UPI0020C11CE7|nr:hypothetical protein [Butyrivibrio fibrisolvens]